MKKNTSSVLFVLFLHLFSFMASSQTITQLSFYSSISVFDMTYINNHLIVSQNGLLIFDVTNPSSIKLVGTANYPGGNVAQKVAAQGNNAYLAEGSPGIFAVYNISNFRSPALSGSVSLPDATGDIAPNGNYVYVGGLDSLYVVNVSNPSSPQVVKAVLIPQPGPTGGDAVRVSGNSLFVMAGSSWKVYNISNPASPVLVISVPNTHVPEQGLSVDTINHRVFLPWLSNSLQYMGYDAYNLSNPSSPVLLFRDSTAYGSGGFGISTYSYTNNVLYLTEFATIQAFDVSANHKYLTSFHGIAVANGIVAMDVKDSVFFDAKGGGLEVLKLGGPVATTCNVPTGLNAGNITNTGTALSWTAVTGVKSYNLQWKATSSSGWTTVTGLTTTSYNLAGLTGCTGYQFQVQCVCSAGAGAYSGTASFTTTGCSEISYCASKGTNTSRGYINKVSLETINNTSGNNGGYGNYTNLSASLQGGATYTIGLTPGFVNGAAYTEYWTVYIDYNQNGIFDPGEMVATGHAAIKVNKSFTIPANALNGSTHMRIQMQEGAGETNPCATYFYGEVEDYTVVITGNAKIATAIAANSNIRVITGKNTSDFMLYPNPAKDHLIVEYSGKYNGRVQVNVYNLLGERLINSVNSSVTGTNIFNLNTSKLGTGIYILEIENNGQRQSLKLLISR